MSDPYSQNAAAFFEQYQRVRFEDVHGIWLPSLPDQPGFALDIGAGSGRDALALAKRGWEVLAVEPSALAELGKKATAGYPVQWLSDSLPELAHVRALGYRFQLILLSAVWMHVRPDHRQRAFRILSELLAPGGLMVVTLREGPDTEGRHFYPVSSSEFEPLCRERAIQIIASHRADDFLGRAEVQWQTLLFRLPDDGTGALPVLRHIIVNDDKSSTYKLALLRAVTRIADELPGMILKRDDTAVDIPLGLVALYWIRLYQPLLRNQIRQAPGVRGYAFASDSFYALDTVSPYDLRVGARVAPDLAIVLRIALSDAAKTIVKMPIRYTCWPGTSTPIFDGELAGFRHWPEGMRLDRETLARFGVMRVPVGLWDSFSRYACWLEPAIVNEWEQVMMKYDGLRYNRDIYHTCLQWQEGRRDTREVRLRVQELISSSMAPRCVWTNSDLRRRGYEIDHCFPWSRWSNNDLWNLMPATVQANASKSEKLPSAALLQDARHRITSWWQEGYLNTPREEQFFIEAESALPLVRNSRTIEAVFEGLQQQRLRLRMNQQLAEWMGMNG
jgi:SAM-dependent methyltransferase